MTPRHARPRIAVALAVAAAHLVLLGWWLHADRLLRAIPTVSPRVAVRLVALPSRPPELPRETRRAEPAAREAVPRRRAVAAPTRPDEERPAPVATPQAITLAPAPEPRASESLADPRPSLMDSEATRRAIRAAAREPGLATQAGRQGPALQTPDERLGERVQKSAKGDCLKGEFFGGGAGLLSLPFLAAAALNDQCRR